MPPQAMEEAADFIAFLRARHGAAAPAHPAFPEAAEAGEAFFGLWRDRTDLADASTWVDELRGLGRG